ncbi:hypothetical protein H1R20_g15013, partial [Candolleomyces eurysporus]
MSHPLKNGLATAPELGGTHQRGIQTLANETLSMIAERTMDDDRAFTGLMLASPRLAGVCEYLRYTSVTVQGTRGRRLLATLISGTPTSKRYCKLVKRAWFRYWHETEMYLVSTLMCEALPLMDNLITLRIDAHTIDEAHTLNRMDRAGLIRASLHPAFLLGSSTSNEILFSPLTLAKLENYMVSGSFSLVALTNHRTLSEIYLDCFMDRDDLAEFISKAECTILGHSLQTLSVKFVRSISLRLAIPLLSKAFPMIKNMSIEQASMEVLAALDVIGGETTNFVHLRHLALNRRLAFPLLKWGSKLEGNKPLSDAVHLKLQTMHFKHAKLSYFGMGKVLWVKVEGGSFVEAKCLNSCDWWDNVIGKQFHTDLYPQP